MQKLRLTAARMTNIKRMRLMMVTARWRHPTCPQHQAIRARTMLPWHIVRLHHAVFTTLTAWQKLSSMQF
ncbi:hypothetical protein ROS217_02500 [Roseovarius sp. 217]|nr:hypothetical protein ROS217_02500 [Roseovarius sp. 217]